MDCIGKQEHGLEDKVVHVPESCGDVPEFESEQVQLLSEFCAPA